ncbi:Mu transposase C-terminal domain-containing protein [Methylobacterium sp. Leaf125]|uniref:Mu transposase C-terminal domain-containing protein n=1 Tax=Methylobacterium sp. Leaf125 TaxID=1736265 RepID=UPI00138EFDEA|nr:Mu transposase C-terminal domain-containing protein [Methylobacterium sp. Leaf125]
MDSLPLEIQLRVGAGEPPLYDTSNSSSKAVEAATWWAQFLRPILSLPKGSRERRAAISTRAGVEVCGPQSKWFAPSLRDIERKVKKAEDHGLKGLMRKRRETKPESRLILTKRWDAATAGLDDALRAEIAREVRQRIRDLWGGGAAYSVVQRLAGEYLADLTLKAGIGATFAEIMPACELPKGVVEAGRNARRVHQYRTDIKAWDDQRPRVRLTSAGLAPMELVFGDVHHFDVYVARPDGTLATPKGIAWLDAGTRRVRIDLVLCEPGTAIRNSDVIDSFIHMTQDPHWGMPAKLYLDNGSEYGFAEFLPDALKLAGLDCKDFGRGRALIRATAYNAAAKGILEGSFRVIEQTILSAVPGYIGGDRMNSRRANLGKAPSPFNGSFDDFAHDFVGLLAFYNTKRQTGDLAGRSPEQAYAQAVAAGWQRTDVDELALMTAFSMEARRTVQDGKIRIGGEWFYCDELARHTGDSVSVRLPKYLCWPAVPVFTTKGELIGIALPDPVYSRLDPAGASEAARRKGVARDAIRAEAADLNRIDVKAEMIASGRRQSAPPVPASKGTIELGRDRAEIGRRIMESPTERRDRDREEKQAKLKATLERTARFRGL